MAKYGNILAVIDSSPQAIIDITVILKKYQVLFESIDNLFYIETISKKNTKDIIADLNTLDIQFLFFHNNISDGSLIKSKGIDDTTIKAIQKILFK
jgi:hypothetical protein